MCDEYGADRTKTWAQEEIRRKVIELGDWFHNLDLGGVQTAPHHFLGDYPACKWRAFADAIPADLSGKTVLDIGCNAGFYSLEMKRRGAARVVGIDSDPVYLAQARFAAEVRGREIEFRELDVYHVESLRRKSSTWCCSWACSTICVIRCWRWICCRSTWWGTRWCSNR